MTGTGPCQIVGRLWQGVQEPQGVEGDQQKLRELGTQFFRFLVLKRNGIPMVPECHYEVCQEYLSMQELLRRYLQISTFYRAGWQGSRVSTGWDKWSWEQHCSEVSLIPGESILCQGKAVLPRKSGVVKEKLTKSYSPAFLLSLVSKALIVLYYLLREQL